MLVENYTYVPLPIPTTSYSVSQLISDCNKQLKHEYQVITV